MQIFSLHWMMQNIRLFNVCEAFPSGFTDIKKPNILHHPVQAKKSAFQSLIV